MDWVLLTDILLFVIAIIVGTLELQIVRGNRLVGETIEALNETKRQQNQNAQIVQDKLRESLNDVKRQQNQNAQIIRDELTRLLNNINKDIAKAADANSQLSQNLRDSRVQINNVLEDLRKTNFQMLARIEVLDRAVKNGNGHT